MILHQAALAITLLLPWFLLHIRAATEIGIDLTAAAFLTHCATHRTWGWLRQTWAPLAIAWWAWLVICTAIAIGQGAQHPGALLQAILVARFLLLTAALERWVFAAPRHRAWFTASLAAATLYVALQTLLQFATGSNLYGDPRSGDGELTGPFAKPRDAPTFVRMLFPALLPPAAFLLAQKRWLPKTAGIALVAAAAAIIVLIGQRMPVLLAILGLLATGALLPRLRAPAILAVAAGGLLIAASIVISPPTFTRLVDKTTQQLEGFATSPYGLLAERAVAITEQHPLTGAGYDGYRVSCPDPRTFQAWHWPGQPAPPDPSAATLCLTHPHNLYLQAATDAGLPGLVLFCALAGAWLARLGRGLLTAANPLRAGLFVAALIQLWPIASTSPLISLPIGGWFFLLLGLGLAEANAYINAPIVRERACPIALSPSPSSPAI